MVYMKCKATNKIHVTSNNTVTNATIPNLDYLWETLLNFLQIPIMESTKSLKFCTQILAEKINFDK